MISGKSLSGCDPDEARPSSSCSTTCPRVVAEQERRGGRVGGAVNGEGVSDALLAVLLLINASGDAPLGDAGTAPVHACFCRAHSHQHEPRPQKNFACAGDLMYVMVRTLESGSGSVLPCCQRAGKGSFPDTQKDAGACLRVLGTAAHALGTELLNLEGLQPVQQVAPQRVCCQSRKLLGAIPCMPATKSSVTQNFGTYVLDANEQKS